MVDDINNKSAGTEPIILLGFNKESSMDNKSINNFEGILGTFILFNGCLINDKNEVSAIQINAFDISKQTIITIELKKVMTTHKDEVLNELYETEKKGLKIFKDLEKEMKRLGLNDALQEFQRIKKKYEK